MPLHLRRFASLLVLLLALSACSRDDGAGVRVLDGGESGSGSASGSASGVSPGETTVPLGGYIPVSDVAEYAKVSLDVCALNAALAEGDFAAARQAYEQGGNSHQGDGSVRTLRGFATQERDEPTWNRYVEHFGSATWLDEPVSAALAGSGRFADASDVVRSQAAQKGTQNAILIAWVLHELDKAAQKVADGLSDPVEGAAHNVDEAWALYHGDSPDCAPYATADKRGADFGRGSAVNNALLAAFEKARDAGVAGDAEAFAEADAAIRHHILVTYLQAVIKYTETSSEGGEDAEKALAEGAAFYRVIAPQIHAASAAAGEALDEALNGDTPPTPEQAAEALEALRAAYDDLGVTATEIGTRE